MLSKINPSPKIVADFLLTQFIYESRPDSELLVKPWRICCTIMY